MSNHSGFVVPTKIFILSECNGKTLMGLKQELTGWDEMGVSPHYLEFKNITPTAM